jgi:preprotein translocase subunit Sec63
VIRRTFLLITHHLLFLNCKLKIANLQSQTEMTQFDSSKDYYSILGAEEDASRSDIERHYKRMAVKHHPDRGGSEEEMKALNEAYGVLRDDAARSAYDAERQQKLPEVPAATLYTSPGLQLDAVAGQTLSAVLFLGAGLVLALLVRFQWIWFLWPLAILAFCLIAVGVIMARGALRRVGSDLSQSRRGVRVTFELLFWLAVAVCCYGLYLVLR